MSDAGGVLPAPEDGRGEHHVVLNDGSVVKNNKGEPMKKPRGVSLEENARIGQALAAQEEQAAVDAQQGIVSLDDGIINPKDASMIALFWPGLGSMDYQRKFGTDGKIDRDYIDFGNYNYGVVAAAAGYSWEYATMASGLANLLGGGKKPLRDKFNNPDNLKMIRQGFDDYGAGKIVPLKN